MEEMPAWNGPHIGPPYLGAAVICHLMFEDGPGLTDIGHIHSDTLLCVAKGQRKATLATEGSDLFLWVHLYACEAVGDYELDVRFLAPSGARVARQVATCSLNPDGVSAVIPIATLTTTESGRHLFEIGVDGRLLTKVPYQVEILETGSA